MERHNESHAALRVLEPHMASSLTHLLPANPAERPNELVARDDGKALAHAGIVSLRRTTSAWSG